jgi:hypothetical protein
MMRAAIGLAMLLTACGGHGTAPGGDMPAALRDDLVGYATASCLLLQDNSYLQDQGQRWAGAIMQNAHGGVEKWAPVAAAVRAELATSGVAQGQGEGPRAPTTPLPVMTCGRITSTPIVRRAIDLAARSLAADYSAPMR